MPRVSLRRGSTENDGLISHAVIWLTVLMLPVDSYEVHRYLPYGFRFLTQSFLQDKGYSSSTTVSSWRKIYACKAMVGSTVGKIRVSKSFSIDKLVHPYKKCLLSIPTTGKALCQVPKRIRHDPCTEKLEILLRGEVNTFKK